MNRAYEFMMKLQDLFSPQLMKLANTYGKVIGTMERKKAVVGGIFSGAGKSVDALRQKLFGLSSVNSRLRVDSSEIDAATRKAGRLRDVMGRFVGGSGGGAGGGGGGGMLGRFQNVLRGGALGGMLLGGVGGYLGMQGLEMANDKFIQPAFRSERNQFSTGVMLGSDEAGKALMSQLAKYAADNPVFDKPEVQAAGQLFVGVNEQLERIIPRLSMLGDVAAGSGNDLLGLTTIIAKIKAQGRVQGDELMQLMERRINILPELANVKGVGQGDVNKLVSKGLVSYEDVMAAFARMTGQGGMYHDMGNRIANETEGGKYQKVLGDLAEKSEQIGMKLLPYVSLVMDFVSQLLSNMQPLESGFSTLSIAIGEVWNYLSTLLSNLGLINERASAAQVIMQTLGLFFTLLGNAIEFVTGVLTAFTDSPLAMLITGLVLLPTVIGAVSTAWLALNTAFALSPIGFIIAGVVAIAAVLMTAWDKVDWFREGVIKMWETVKNIFKNLGSVMFKLFVEGDIAGAVATIRGAFNKGQENGMDAVVADRNKRLAENVPKGMQGGNLAAFAGGGAGKPGKGGSKTLDSSSGLTSTVGGNTKSNNITINVGSLIAKSEINVMDFQGDISELESKVIAVLSRLVNSANQLVIAE